MVGVKGLKPSTSRSQTGRAINCATPRRNQRTLQNYSAFPVQLLGVYTKNMEKPPYKAPDFTLSSDDGRPVELKDFKGKWVVLYFYPKDDTPGCTTEACSLRDARDDLAAHGAEIVGISKDSASSHEKFKAKHSLNFTLLSDPDGEAIEAYGAWGPKMFGRLGIQRKTFLIDPKGIVQKVYGRVTPDGHGEQIKKDLSILRG